VLRQPVALAQRCKDLIRNGAPALSVGDATVLLLQARFAVRRPRWIRASAARHRWASQT
jgi:hypothetical protein